MVAFLLNQKYFEVIQSFFTELNYKDPELHYRVDIGLPHTSYSRSEQLKKRLEILKANRKNLMLEKLAQTKQRALYQLQKQNL